MRGRFPDGKLVICKTYTAQRDLIDLNPVQNEIEILTIISNRSSDDDCFIKFY